MLQADPGHKTMRWGRTWRAKALVTAALVLIIVLTGLWLSSGADLTGRWENDEWLLFFFDGRAVILSKDCTGWPEHSHERNAEVAVSVAPGLPGRLALHSDETGADSHQSYYSVGRWLIIRGDGPIPSATYSFASPHPVVSGICSVQKGLEQ